ncbi:hypothetical protein PO909_031979 [Leuciscus waleckii]
MILNGVCVIWKGWIDLQRLDGMGCLEYDDERAQQEDALAQAAFEEARRRTRDFEDRDRSHREDLEEQVNKCHLTSFLSVPCSLHVLSALDVAKQLVWGNTDLITCHLADADGTAQSFNNSGGKTTI